MRRTIEILSSAFYLTLFLTAAPATAQVLVSPFPAVTVSAGYSNLQTERAANLFYDHSGPYVDADFAWRLPLIVPLQAGFGVTGSGYFDRESVYFPNNNNFYYPYDRLYSDVGMLELEPRIGVRLGGDSGFFAIPRVGAGLLIDSYAVDQSNTINSNTYFSTDHHTGAAFEVRPAIQAGYSWGPASVGLEASYLYAWGDFGGLGHHAQEIARVYL